MNRAHFERVLPYLKNKYIVSVVIFLVWMLFFDRNDFISQYSYHKELNKLMEDKAYFQGQIEENKRSIHELMSDPANLEKFAREKYHMKKPDEDVFLIITPEKNATQNELTAAAEISEDPE